MISAIIIDDVEIHRRDLRRIIETNHAKDMVVVGEAENIIKGMKLIKLENPDLVFLDILLPPDGTGFDLLENFGVDNLDFGVIFTTQFEQFAIRAFKFGAIDYLLKPVDEKELMGAFLRYQQQRYFRKDQMEVVLQHYNNPENPKNEIILNDLSGNPIKINPNNIIRCEAAGSSCNYYLINSKFDKTMVSHSLGDEAERLSMYPFLFRSHKSHLVNLKHIKKVIYQGEGGIATMIDNSTVEISKRRKKEFKAVYNDYNK